MSDTNACVVQSEAVWQNTGKAATMLVSVDRAFRGCAKLQPQLLKPIAKVGILKKQRSTLMSIPLTYCILPLP